MAHEVEHHRLEHALHERLALVRQVGEPPRPRLLAELGTCPVSLFRQEVFDEVRDALPSRGVRTPRSG